MNEAIVLDSGPLGLLCHPRSSPAVRACRSWLADLLAAGRRVLLPEISDYEIRREVIRLRSVQSLANLDDYQSTLEYCELSTVAMLLAAELWAQARQGGYQTASNDSLDGDVILAAQAISLGVPVVVATLNRRHISRYVNAEQWDLIVP